MPVVLNVVRVRGVAYSGKSIDRVMCAPLFPNPVLAQWAFAIPTVLEEAQVGINYDGT